MEISELKEYWKDFPEAPYSDTFKWQDADGYEHMLTVRGWSGSAMLEAVKAAKAVITDAGGGPAGRHIPTPASAETKMIPIDDGGNELPEVKTFTADKLSVSMKDGKYYFKVIGKPFVQYGVTVWNEVLEAAGLDVTPGAETPNIAGWRADYIETVKDGKKHMKVTRLLPPK